jgi:uncharacterized protein
MQSAYTLQDKMMGDSAEIKGARMLRIIIAGGRGHVGSLLARHFHARGDSVVVLVRTPTLTPYSSVGWDGRTLGDWVRELESADVLINLVGRSVDCRYSKANKQEILDSRVCSTRLLGEAVRRLKKPPRVWVNASTATIYRHALDRDMDEETGEISGNDADTPRAWHFSIEVATQWEHAFFTEETSVTRKVALRSAMVMSADRGGVFDALLRLVRFGLGGRLGNGRQYVSWIHERDFERAIDFLIERHEFRGVINLSAPKPVPNAEFMRALRHAWGSRVGVAAPRWALEIGAFVLRTETELILKSRRVVPGQLLKAGFGFDFPEWPAAAADLVTRWRMNQ